MCRIDPLIFEECFREAMAREIACYAFEGGENPMDDIDLLQQDIERYYWRSDLEG